MPVRPLAGPESAAPEHLVEAHSQHEPAASYECDGCGRDLIGPPAGHGLFLWTRGTEIRYEEPPLCPDCAANVVSSALLSWSAEGGEEA
jgi:hypothetical protein